MAKTTKAKGKQNRSLNAKNKQAIELYLSKNPRNGGEAYMQAHPGVKNKSVASAAFTRLLKSVKGKAYLEKREKEIFAKRFEVTQDNIAREISVVANARASDFYNFDGKKCEFKSFDEIPVELHGAIKSIETDTVSGITTKIKVVFHNKDKALELLARHKGMLNDKSTLTVEAGDTLKAFLEGVSGKTLGPPGLRKHE